MIHLEIGILNDLLIGILIDTLIGTLGMVLLENHRMNEFYRASFCINRTCGILRYTIL